MRSPPPTAGRCTLACCPLLHYNPAITPEVEQIVKPIYATNGEWVALLQEGYLYDTLGEYIAWLDGKDVYTRDGMYAGFLSDNRRILRERIRRQRTLRATPPAPPRIRPPATVPLAPLFAELPWSLVDIFEEEPEIFRYVSELRPDWED